MHKARRMPPGPRPTACRLGRDAGISPETSRRRVPGWIVPQPATAANDCGGMKKSASRLSFRTPSVAVLGETIVISKSARVFSVLSALVLVACKEDDKPAPPPPPPPAAKPATCASGGKLGDAQSAPFFPRTTGAFCLDPNGGDKTFGDQASLP